MNGKRTYAVGILTLALSMGCVKQPSTLPSSLPEEKAADLAVGLPKEKVADLAAWLPEEAEGFAVVSSLEALKASLEVLEKHAAWKPLEEPWKAFQKKALEETGLDLFSLSTWQALGLHTQAPLMFSFGSNTHADTTLLALPMLDAIQFLAFFEKHVVNKAEWKAQPDMLAWEKRQGSFILLAQKPGYMLILSGKDLAALQKGASPPKEKSWAKHKEVLLEIDSRLPENRVVSLWFRADGGADKWEEAGIQWLGAGVVTHPRVKVVVDLTWRHDKSRFIPKLETEPFEPKQWTQSLGNATGALWSSATWDWYTQLLKAFKVDQEKDFDADVIFGILGKSFAQDFAPPVLLRGWIQTETREDDEGVAFPWSVDVVPKEGSSAKLWLNWASLLSPRKKADITQLNLDMPVWKMQMGTQALFAYAPGQNKARLANRPPRKAFDNADALQEQLMTQMMNYPISAAIHLNGLMEYLRKNPTTPLPLRDIQLEKTEYILLGLRAEESHAQLTGEHFVETSPRSFLSDMEERD